MNQLKPHPLADAFPLVEGAEFEELISDIAAHGLREAITMFEGCILDGRNRDRACRAAGVEPRFTQYSGADPVGFVISANLRRCHLTESQRAMVADKLATMRLGADQHTESLSIGRASPMLSVRERSVARAREILEHGSADLQPAVQRGDVSVSTAADIASQPQAEQDKIVAPGYASCNMSSGNEKPQRVTARANLVQDSSTMRGLSHGRQGAN